LGRNFIDDSRPLVVTNLVNWKPAGSVAKRMGLPGLRCERANVHAS